MFASSLWKFSRPHTIIATTISILSVTFCAVDSFAEFVELRVLFAVALALISSLCINVYIVGLNQLFDIPIDVINKPTLPLASGEFTPRTGWTIVCVCASIGLTLGYFFGTTPLWWTLTLTMFLGTIYSVPPFRLKRFPLLAAFCILAVRGVFVQIGFYFHIKTVLANFKPIQYQVTGSVLFACAFVVIFSIIIALFKDIPDVEGDAKHSIRSFSVRVGVPRVFHWCLNLLLVDYAIGVLVGLASGIWWSRFLTVCVHLVLCWVAHRRASQVVFSKQVSLTAYYMFLWKLFYLEYLIFPFIR